MALISVLMPVFNVERFVSEAIESVLEQTFADIELVIIDDASSDSTVDIVKKYKKKDKRIVLVENKVNIGISRALNKGLSLCSGKYIARADGDDIMHPERLYRQYSYLESNPEFALVGCWIKNIDEKGNLLGECQYPCCHDDITKLVKWTSPVLHVWLCRSSIYNLFGGYRDTNPAEDYDFLLRCISQGFKVANIPFIGAYIRLRQGNTLSVLSLKQRKIFNYLYKLYQDGRINNSNDLCLFSKPEIKTSRVMEQLHLNSTKFLVAGFETNNLKRKILYFSLSLISPYTVVDIYRRLRFKRELKKIRG